MSENFFLLSSLLILLIRKEKLKNQTFFLAHKFSLKRKISTYKDCEKVKNFFLFQLFTEFSTSLPFLLNFFGGKNDGKKRNQRTAYWMKWKNTKEFIFFLFKNERTYKKSFIFIFILFCRLQQPRKTQKKKQRASHPRKIQRVRPVFSGQFCS